MNREALEQTIRVLEEVKKRELDFDLSTFVGWTSETGENHSIECNSNTREAHDFAHRLTDDGPDLRIPHACGCTACATGYAGLDPWFRSRGFKTTCDGTLKLVVKDKKTIHGWDAIEAFYDLNEAEADWLFMPFPYSDVTDPQLVIDRIKEVLEDGFPVF